MVLVPATMSLLGKANWWLPAWLDRALPHLTVEGSVDGGHAQDADRDPTYVDAAPVVPTPKSSFAADLRKASPLVPAHYRGSADYDVDIR